MRYPRGRTHILIHTCVYNLQAAGVGSLGLPPTLIHTLLHRHIVGNVLAAGTAVSCEGTPPHTYSHIIVQAPGWKRAGCWSCHQLRGHSIPRRRGRGVAPQPTRPVIPAGHRQVSVGLRWGGGKGSGAATLTCSPTCWPQTGEQRLGQGGRGRGGGGGRGWGDRGRGGCGEREAEGGESVAWGWEGEEDDLPGL